MRHSFRQTLLRISMLIATVAVSFSFRHEDVIKDNLAFLIGDYHYICSYDNGVKKESTAITDKYTLRITRKSDMIVYKNGKKLEKYDFSSVTLPVLDEHQYVMFHKKEQYYPLFYKGDTVVMHIHPFEFNDNYFVKTKK